MAPPKSLHWLFWEVDPERVDVERDADYVMARIVERGTLKDVEWVLSTYGDDRVHQFFREAGHPELSPRTLSFWRAYFQAKDETWANPGAFRRNSAAPWID
jgi:hypothetical protein